MQKSVRFILAAALIGLGIWGWMLLFPSPEKVIRSHLLKLAKTASFDSKEGALARAYNSESLAEYFTSDVEIEVNLREYPQHSLHGRDELLQAVLWVRSNMRGLKVKFVDINITLAPDKQTALANLTCEAFVTGERDFTPQEFNFKLKKVDKQWLIYRVETVNTLSWIQPKLLQHS